MENPPRVSSSKPARAACWSAISSDLFTLSRVDSMRYETRCGAVINSLVGAEIVFAFQGTKQKSSGCSSLPVRSHSCQRTSDRSGENVSQHADGNIILFHLLMRACFRERGPCARRASFQGATLVMAHGGGGPDSARKYPSDRLAQALLR